MFKREAFCCRYINFKTGFQKLQNVLDRGLDLLLTYLLTYFCMAVFVPACHVVGGIEIYIYIYTVSTKKRPP